MDSKNFLYLPQWVKIISITVLVLSLVLGAAVSVFFASRQDKSDYVLIGMSLAQTSASGLVLALVVFFSERDNSINLLIKKTKYFLKKEIPSGLRRIIKNTFKENLTIILEDENTSDILQRYTLKFGEKNFSFSITLNIKRIVIVAKIKNEEDIVEKLESTILGAKHVGFDVNFKEEGNFSLIYFRKNLDTNILENNSERFFWINDIALMIRDIIINSSLSENSTE